VIDPWQLPIEGPALWVRQATAEDVAAIVRLLSDDPIGTGREDVGDLTAYVEAFARIDADPAHALVVVTDAAHADEVIGTLQLSILPGLARRAATRGQIEAVRVAGSQRGRGVGAAMIRWAIDEAGRRGCTLVQLTSDKARPDAHRFYESLGFVATHEGFKLDL